MDTNIHIYALLRITTWECCLQTPSRFARMRWFSRHLIWHFLLGHGGQNSGVLKSNWFGGLMEPIFTSDGSIPCFMSYGWRKNGRKHRLFSFWVAGHTQTTSWTGDGRRGKHARVVVWLENAGQGSPQAAKPPILIRRSMMRHPRTPQGKDSGTGTAAGNTYTIQASRQAGRRKNGRHKQATLQKSLHIDWFESTKTREGRCSLMRDDVLFHALRSCYHEVQLPSRSRR